MVYPMPEVSPSRYLVMAGWDDVPHIKESTKKELLASTLPHLRDARSKGIPALGSGAIYPVPESEFVIDDIEIPKHWPKGYALDVGWKKTAAIWGAHDRESDILYLYSEYYKGKAEPSVHADGIRSRGKWIPGCIDPAARGRSQHDGKKLIDSYNNLGLELSLAKNAVEAGLFEVFTRLTTGRLKVFKSMKSFLGEYRIYRRDEDGKIVKENDHLMDAMRYLAMTMDIMKTQPHADFEDQLLRNKGPQGWMGR
jgi:hypothetical protein